MTDGNVIVTEYKTFSSVMSDEKKKLKNDRVDRLSLHIFSLGNRVLMRELSQ